MVIFIGLPFPAQCRLLITCVNGLDLDQANRMSDLVARSKLFDTQVVLMKDSFDKVNFDEKKKISMTKNVQHAKR